MSAPEVPNAGKTANAQLKYGKKAAVYQQLLNQTNQQTPYGSLKYVQTGKKHGIPQFTVKQKMSPEQQGLYEGEVGQAEGIMDSNDWSQGPDMSANGLQERTMQWGNDYYQPIFDQQNAQLEAKLRNQGIAPGTQAYNDAVNLASRNQNDAYTNLLLKGTDQAMRAAQSEYFDPLTAYSSLTSGQQPQWAQTPQSGVAQPNYQGAVADQYNAESQNYQNTMGGLFSIPKAILGGWAAGGLG